MSSDGRADVDEHFDCEKGTRLVRPDAAADLGAHMARSDRGIDDPLTRAMHQVSYEILPFANAEAKVLAHVPTTVALTVTTTQARGLGPTLDLATRLARHGYRVAPHLPARLVLGEDHLADIAGTLDQAGVDDIFVIAGDADTPAGPYDDAFALLQSLHALGRRFRTVGIAGYPEGHGRISDELLEQALAAKAPHANEIVTQMCFDPRATVAWALATRSRGISLPIRVGIPGVVSRQKLVRIGARLGLGQSARFIRKQRGFVTRLITPSGYRPDRLVWRLAPHLAAGVDGIVGFHVFTFNELESTEAWRRAWLARAIESAAGREQP